MIKQYRLSVIAAAALPLLAACAERDHFVVAATSTVVGVQVGQTATSTSPEAKLGYNRSELAIVPTNRGDCRKDQTADCTPTHAGGALDTTDVIMELRYGGGLTAGTNQAIYQRLAIGATAVKAQGSAVMFAKEPNGEFSEKSAQALNSVQKIQESDADVQKAIEVLASEARQDKANIPFLDKAAAADGKFKDYSDFVAKAKSIEEVEAVRLKYLNLKAVK